MPNEWNNLNHQIGFTYTLKERKCSFREYDRIELLYSLNIFSFVHIFVKKEEIIEDMQPTQYASYTLSHKLTFDLSSLVNKHSKK